MWQVRPGKTRLAVTHNGVCLTLNSEYILMMKLCWTIFTATGRDIWGSDLCRVVSNIFDQE